MQLFLKLMFMRGCGGFAGADDSRDGKEYQRYL
jgi:hypothetical protein